MPRVSYVDSKSYPKTNIHIKKRLINITLPNIHLLIRAGGSTFAAIGATER